MSCLQFDLTGIAFEHFFLILQHISYAYTHTHFCRETIFQDFIIKEVPWTCVIVVGLKSIFAFETGVQNLMPLY